jgi:hypothetical protein
MSFMTTCRGKRRRDRHGEESSAIESTAAGNKPSSVPVLYAGLAIAVE